MSLSVCLVSAEYPPETTAGGVGTYTHDLAHGLMRLGHRVTVVSATPAGGVETTRHDSGVRIVRVAPKQSLRRRVALRGKGPLLRSLVARSDRVIEAIHDLGPFDVVEAPLWNGEASSWDGLAGTPLVTRLVTPVFTSMKILESPPALELEELERRQCLASTCLAAISTAIGELVVSHYGLQSSVLVHAPLGIRIPNAIPSPRSTVPRLLYVGRLERRKGISDLLAALPAVLKNCPSAVVDLVGQDTGQGPRGLTYAALADEMLDPDVRSRVTFHGFVPKERLASFYARASVFVAPSLYESFGLVYLEAMSLGVPVVGTDVGGVSEIVDDTVGRLVAAGDPGALALACTHLLQDSTLALRLGTVARARVRERFSESAMAASTVRLYELAIGL